MPLDSRQRRPRERVSAATIAGLSALLVLPYLAVLRISLVCDIRIILGYLAVVSLVTILSYRQDKKHAEAGKWRTPEFTLHLLELLGGWPAAFLAQRIFRHKISKISYQVRFWLIVFSYELVSLDFLQNWRYFRALILLITHE